MLGVAGVLRLKFLCSGTENIVVLSLCSNICYPSNLHFIDTDETRLSERASLPCEICLLL
jgi:hypothetical protein